METTAASLPQTTPDSDPYLLDPSAIATPPASLGQALLKIGPGLILAGAIVGTGELIATTNLGAKVGFTLLWLVIFSCFIKVFVQVELGRSAITTGKTSMASFRELPGAGKSLGWIWVIMILTTQFQLGAMVGGVGQAFHMVMPDVSPWAARCIGSINGGWGAYLSGRPELLWCAVTVASVCILLARGSYAIVEWGTTLMVVAFTLTTVLCVALLPASGHPIPWGSVVAGLEFRLPPGAIGSAMAMFGITGVGAAELVAYPYWCIEKGYARKTGLVDNSSLWLERAKGWIRVMRLDTWVSFLVYTLATLGFYFLGAAVLAGRGGEGLPSKIDAMLITLSHMYEPVMGARASTWFIVIGAFAVLYSTLFASTGANSRVVADFLKCYGYARFDRGEDRRRLVRMMCIGFPILDFGLFVWVGNPVAMVMIGGIAQALTLPLIGAAALYMRYRRTDARLTPTRAWDALLWLSVLGLTLAAAWGGFDAVKKVLK